MHLIKNGYYEYWINDKNQMHGEYKEWWDNGELSCHEYWSHGEVVRDLLKEPVTEEDKFMLTLEHGGKWLCD